MIITKIQRLRGKRLRYGVYLEGSLALELSEWTLSKFGLRTGDDLDKQRIRKITTSERETSAKNIAVNYLSYRPRSSKEVVDHLVKKGFEHGCAVYVCSHLQSIGMMNDPEFARLFIRDRLKRKLIGQALLRQQLLSKGIAPATADMVLKELISPESQQAAALQAARRKIKLARKSIKEADSGKKKKRLLDFLLRRGFSYEIASKTIRTTLKH